MGRGTLNYAKLLRNFPSSTINVRGTLTGTIVTIRVMDLVLFIGLTRDLMNITNGSRYVVN